MVTFRISSECPWDSIPARDTVCVPITTQREDFPAIILTRELHQVVDCLDGDYVRHLVEDDFHLVEGAHIFMPTCDGSHLINQTV
jgi:hypothetical protein